jgi:flagellar motor component MotA
MSVFEIIKSFMLIIKLKYKIKKLTEIIEELTDYSDELDQEGLHTMAECVDEKALAELNNLDSLNKQLKEVLLCLRS